MAVRTSVASEPSENLWVKVFFIGFGFGFMVVATISFRGAGYAGFVLVYSEKSIYVYGYIGVLGNRLLKPRKPRVRVLKLEGIGGCTVAVDLPSRLKAFLQVRPEHGQTLPKALWCQMDKLFL